MFITNKNDLHLNVAMFYRVLLSLIFHPLLELLNFFYELLGINNNKTEVYAIFMMVEGRHRQIIK